MDNSSGVNSAPLKILVAVDFSLCPQALNPLKKLAQITYVPDADQVFVVDNFASHDAYLGHINVQVTRSMIESSPQLRVVCACSTGTDHLDVQALEDHDIDLISLTQEYELLNTFTSTAEMAWGLLLACRRQIPRMFEHAKTGHAQPPKEFVPPPQLSGKTLGVIGYGRLGRMVAEYGRSFRMRVLAHDPYKTVDAVGVEQVDFDTLISESDVISLHVHLRPDTYRMIDRDVIGCMKRGVTLINVARGDLICEQSLLESLQDGHVMAAGLDVVHDEWDRTLSQHPLYAYARSHDNLILTPHIGGGSLESIVDARVFVARRLGEYLTRRSSAPQAFTSDSCSR